MVQLGRSGAPLLMYADIGEIASLTSREWEAHMNLLNDKERNEVLKYRFDDDRRRALVSLLLQKFIVRRRLGVESNVGFEINRTPEVRLQYDIRGNKDHYIN